MAARFVYWMNVSLDLRIERNPGDDGGGDWLRIDEPLHEVFNERARRLTQSVEGRIVYEIMEEFWPAARHDDSLPDFMREYGEIWTNGSKILVSNTRTEAAHNTRIIGGSDAIEQLAAVRRDGEGDIGVGGATVATALLRANLLDELLLFTHPVVLGEGRPLFDDDDLAAAMELDLLEHEAYPNGVTLHRYAVRGALPAG